MKIEIVEDVDFKCLRVKEGDIVLLEITHATGGRGLSMALNKGDEYFVEIPCFICKKLFCENSEYLGTIRLAIEDACLQRFADAFREMLMHV